MIQALDRAIYPAMILYRNKSVRLLMGFLETVNWVSLRLWLQDRAAARQYHGRMFRAFMSHYRNGPWQSRSIHELFPEAGRVQVVLEHHPGKGIYTPIDELAYLALLTRLAAPRVVFEIGTFLGRTALNFALNSPPDTIVYTMDLPPEERAEFCQTTNAADTAIIRGSRTGELFRNRPEAAKIKQLLGNSLTYDFTPYHGQADIVFIDGAHHYAAVSKDTRSALALVKPGGWIIWHDFANYGDYNDVTRAVLNILPGDRVIQIEDTQLALYRQPANGAAAGARSESIAPQS